MQENTTQTAADIHREDREQAQAVITDFRVGNIGPHSFFTVKMRLDGDGVGRLELPQYAMQGNELLKGILNSVGVKEFGDVEGESVMVEYIPGDAVKAPRLRALEPVYGQNGVRFDLLYWEAWAEAQNKESQVDAALPSKAGVSDSDWTQLAYYVQKNAKPDY